MDISTYAAEAEVEATHWWFVVRRRLFAAELQRMGIPRNAHILDVGTSTGTNLRMLRDNGYPNVSGLDFSADAIRYCAQKGFDGVRQGDVCAIPYDSGSFDLVLATDIIEHVDDDITALREIRRVLRPGGQALVTVPAFQSLWGLQDNVSQHKRRYRISQLLQVARTAGLQPMRWYYFNFILFIPILIARRIIKAAKVEVKSENQLNTPFVNRLLKTIFLLDVTLAPFLPIPFGVSALTILRKEGDAGGRG